MIYFQGYFQLFQHHAASDVRDVLLSHHPFADERLVYAHRKYARLDAGLHRRQSPEIPRRSHAFGLSERKRHRGDAPTALRALRFRRCVQCLGCRELSEKFVGKSWDDTGKRCIFAP